MEVFDIAIIGFGASGVGLLNEIQNEVFTKRHLKPNIAIFNNQKSFAKGKAFGDASPIHIVNTPPELMSPSVVEPNGFWHWLREQNSMDSRWPTRITFAKYLEYVYSDIHATGLLNLHEVQRDVLSLQYVEGAFELALQDGELIKASEVVLCLGSLNSSNFSDLEELPGFINHHTQYNQTVNEPVLIAGSGLTAVDAFRHLDKSKNARANIFSRNGLAPTCLSEKHLYAPKYLTWNSLIRESHLSPLKAFMKLLLKEHRSLQNESEFKTAIRFLRTGKQAEYFRYLEDRAANADLPWQDVLVSTRYWFHKFWKAMPIQEKYQFVSHFGSLWAAWRHPIPMNSFSQLGNAVDEERLEFFKATSKPTYENGVFRVPTVRGTMESRMLWDGTGGSPVIRNSVSPLLDQLISEGYVEPHPCGGIYINPKTFEVSSSRNEVSGLYNIGPLNKGVLFSTNAFWFNAQCSEKWAHQWAKRAEAWATEHKVVV
ncbi:FAD/NAD(P)-binding protein [Vibrio sp. St2]|uniref:FAD/NAD(P)-binding protein n=1 Tax=Vibrio sp. St2 TaxID=2853441 RepID=UPI00248D62A8|nr:FAD/NAD(P)-binding protein [Vibrio sp. St2]